MTSIIHPANLYSRLRLLPYQSAFAANPSRFKIGLWARQTGKDHTAAAEAVIDCLYHPGTTWIILAAGERQALESLAKAKDWAAILQFEIDDYIEAPANLPLQGSAGLARQGSSQLAVQSSSPESSRSDHLGSFARNWDEVSERARIHFDVPKEDWARRQSLHNN